MNISLYSTKTAVWMAQHPGAVRIAAVAVSIALSLVAAAFNHTAAFACQPIVGGGGCGG